MKEWPVVKKKLSELQPASYNPRRITPEKKLQLRKSLEEHGIAEKIVYNKLSGNVVGGHQRLTEMLDAGIEETLVVEVELTPAKERSLNLALNKIDGEWDKAKLHDLIVELDTLDVDLSIAGFDSDEVERILGVAPQLDLPDDVQQMIDDGKQIADLLPNIKSSHIKMVQLLFTEEQHAEFLKKLEQLRKVYNKDNITDIIMAVVDEAHTTHSVPE